MTPPEPARADECTEPAPAGDLSARPAPASAPGRQRARRQRPGRQRRRSRTRRRCSTGGSASGWPTRTGATRRSRWSVTRWSPARGGPSAGARGAGSCGSRGRRWPGWSTSWAVVDQRGRASTEVDPANPRRVDTAFGPKSVLELPGYEQPWWLTAPAVAGGYDTLLVRGETADALPVTVWSPEGTSRQDRLPLLLVQDGPEYDALASLTRYCAALIASGELPAHRVALLDAGAAQRVVLRLAAVPAHPDGRRPHPPAPRLRCRRPGRGHGRQPRRPDGAAGRPARRGRGRRGLQPVRLVLPGGPRRPARVGRRVPPLPPDRPAGPGGPRHPAPRAPAADRPHLWAARGERAPTTPRWRPRSAGPGTP